MKGMKFWKRITAGMMVLVLTITFSGIRGNAAEKHDVTYIKDFKLYIAENSKGVGSYDEKKEADKAREWFKDNGYTMVEGNLNSGASGALKREVGVYLGYSTTTDSEEAVTDLAVMNERGNYSASEYKRILEEQKQIYTDMVSDMKTMLEEYRTNVNAGVPTAIQSRDFMNGYKDDDSGKLLGDLLMEISDEELGTILMQANGQVVLMIEERLAYACDTGKSTWLDRMVKLGSYKALEKKALKASNNDISKANRALDKKYKEGATVVLENWDDIKQHIDNIRDKIESFGLLEMSPEDIESFFKENKDNVELSTLADEYPIFRMLVNYSYEDGNLVSFFAGSKDDFKGDGIRKLYPMVASLSEGQIRAVNQTVSLFSLILDAINAANFNDYETGTTKELMDKMSDEDRNTIEENEEKVNEIVSNWNEKPAASIYEGVDRDVFKDGVAVTSTALNFTDNDGVFWADAFVDRGYFSKAAIGMAVGSVAFTALAVLTAYKAKKLGEKAAHSMFYDMAGVHDNASDMKKKAEQAVEDSFEFHEEDCSYLLEDTTARTKKIGDVDIILDNKFKHQTDEAKQALLDKAIDEKTPDAIRYQVCKGLKVAFTVASILLAVGDIVMTSITLYKYYNREHLPIPSNMVELSYNEEEQTSFVNYKSVPDQNGGYGDVNGGGGKQWLALYQTHDKDAGDPILAPENGEDYKLIVQYGSTEEPTTENYSTLHLFGTPNTPQNLTFADGENGWSYNDGKKGTYVFFRRGVTEAGDSDSGEE